MRKAIADLHRRAETSQAANNRYFQAFASLEDTTPLGTLTARPCRPVTRTGRRFRAMNSHAPADARLFDVISRGEFAINGFRNRGLRHLVFADANAPKPRRRRHAVGRGALSDSRLIGVLQIGQPHFARCPMQQLRADMAFAEGDRAGDGRRRLAPAMLP
jgi:hypothetical protein